MMDDTQVLAIMAATIYAGRQHETTQGAVENARKILDEVKRRIEAEPTQEGA